jgi:glycosyltransferase involved in cell wall biosynthesis
MPELDIAAVHLTIEGIVAKGGGVCTVTRGHLASLPRVKSGLARKGIRLTPYFVETDFGPTFGNYDPEFRDAAEKQIEEMGGRYYTALNASPNGHPVSANWPGGEDFFGTVDQIKLESVGGASIARNIAKKHQKTVVWCHDTFYIYTPIYGTMQNNDESVQWIRVVHSTTLKHDAEPVDPDKIGAEYASFYWAKRFPNVHIGTISAFVSDHLVEDYAADRDTIIPTGNGVDPLDPKYRIRTQEECEAKVDEYNAKLKAEGKERYCIPKGKKILLQFGRPVPYKRMDVTFEVGKELGDDYQAVVVSLGPAPTIEAAADKYGKNCTVISAFDFDLCACLSQLDRCIAIPILAKGEPFGLIPAEIRLLIRKSGGLLIVPEDGGGLREQVRPHVDGFVAAEATGKSVADVVRKIEAMKVEERNAIRSAGVSGVFEGGYTWAGRILETLSAVVPEVKAVSTEVLAEISAEERAYIGG